MTSIPPSFKPHTLTIPHSTDPSLPPTTVPLRPRSFPPTSPHRPLLPRRRRGQSRSRFSSSSPNTHKTNHLLWSPLLCHLYSTQVDLFQQFRIGVPDLPGYGKSRKAASPDGSRRARSKREVGKDILALVDGLFPVREGEEEPKVVLIGHDRGARVAYRLAKDSPSRISGLWVQDIIPTALQFSRISLLNDHHSLTLKSYHCTMDPPRPPPSLTRISPLLTPNARFWFVHHNLTSWTGCAPRRPNVEGEGETTTFDPRAMRQWVKNYEDDAEVLLGALEDYRAGATIDLEDDEADAVSHLGSTSPSSSSSGLSHGLLAPETTLLALWSAGLERGDPARPGEMRDTWMAIAGGGGGEEEGGRVRAKKVLGEGEGREEGQVEEVAEEVAEVGAERVGVVETRERCHGGISAEFFENWLFTPPSTAFRSRSLPCRRRSRKTPSREVYGSIAVL